MQFDVVILGSGAGGLTAALVAANAGLRVLVAEKTRYFGGTTAYSGGGIWIPDNHHQKAAGLPDSREQAERYLSAMLGNRADPEKLGAYLTSAPAMIAFVEANSEVRTVSSCGVDYEPELAGAALGRSLIVPAYDLRRLGVLRKMLRPPLRQLTEFNGMQIGIEDIAYFANVPRSPRAFAYSAGKLFRHLVDLVVHGGAMRAVNGNALVAELFKSVAEHEQVTMWTDSAAVRLMKGDHGISGVVIARNGEEVEVEARRGVILATGGYGANAIMRAQNIPMAEHGWSLQSEGNSGDGIQLGLEAGGTFLRDNIANAIWIPVSFRPGKDGARTVYPHMYERHKPGFVIVDAAGRRFTNEGLSYQALGHAMNENNVERAFLIGDRRAVRRYGMGLAKPAPLPLKPYLAPDYIRSAATVTELAAQLDIDPMTLTRTIDSYNEHADRGLDPAFHRGEDIYSSAMGDPAHRPNPAVAPLRRPPYYALELRRGELSTTNGLDTNAQAQVLNGAGEAIPGLYAVGVDANSLFCGAYPGAGSSLGPAMTFGYIAARHAAAVG